MLRQIHIDIGFVNGIRWEELRSEREMKWSFEWHNVCAPKQTKGGLKIARWMRRGLDSRSLCSTDRLTYLQEKEKRALSKCITF